jgi:hypothetical protein
VEAETKPMASEKQQWEQWVVTIESHSPDHRHVHGTGVLLAGSNTVATNLHVMRPCVEGLVRMSDGTTFDIAGYAAVDAEHDLALLALREAPPQFPGFTLFTGDPPPRRRVWAIGHPQGQEFSISAGEVSRVLTSGELPAAAQRFVRQLSSDNVRWIQHTARVSEGNSGGPVLDGQGKLLGLNAWMQADSGFTYAVHAQHLHALLQQGASEIIPLAELADAQARTQRQLWDLSATRLQKLLQSARDMQWRPTRREEYRTLQDLAYGVTAALLPDSLSARGELADKLEALILVADQATSVIQKQAWDDPGLITLVNEFADAELSRAGSGLFMFVSIERIVEGDEGERGLIANLAGFERPLFIPLPHDQLAVPQAGAQCLLLGVNPRGEAVKYGNNPLKPVIAPVIVTRTIINLAK